jgi:hypothetical protein
MSIEFESEDLSFVKHRARDERQGMRVVITRVEKRDGQLMERSSESEAGTVDGESHETAEVEDRDRRWKSSGRRKRTEARGKHRDWRGRGEERGGVNVGGDIRVEIDTTADEISGVGRTPKCNI